VSTIAEIRAARERSDRDRDAVERILNLVSEFAKEVGASEYDCSFKHQADEHQRSARAWLVAMLVVAGLTVSAATANYMLASPMQGVVAKLIVFSLPTIATVWCGRIYCVHCHNAVVNRYRQNGLTSLLKILEVARGDAQAKSAVLLQGILSILAPQPSGYLTHEAEPMGRAQLVELIRAIALHTK
jgi:hypothetical protein